ncbi:hypothetical protein NDN11_02210 [Acinetobacter sp. C26M]|uniref:hypothetical protein n=1 Tax=unclassified Acinetobacter TaxID=196816 RepID=UPI002036D951|nr:MULTISPECIES: hypothetical protein [unclassified Acinetobacter]USA46977.1 hypothetical protein NDN11_02210 [Acinetobacter sp. C26M]USA50458.1 hypothetical protein NDN12_02210 [Acinetobacter sp. C26G]
MMSTYQTENSKLLWMIIGGISVVVVLFLAVQWFLAQKDQQPTATPSEPVAAKTIASAQPETVVTNDEVITATNDVAAPIQLVEESIVKAPLPANDSLAKEEIAKLDDIHQQLQDQQHELKQQSSDVDTLLKLKEDQIKLLEAQIAAQSKS